MTSIKNSNIDELDLEILKILSIDSRKNKSTIAEDLKRSPNTIIKHINDLEKDGIIKNYGVQIDYEKLGYEIMAIIEVTISKGKMFEVEEKIAENPNVFGVYDITGTYDALILARFKSREELSKMIKEIHKSPNVKRTNTHFVLNTIKEASSFLGLIKKKNNKFNSVLP
ncbi:MAG: Lrp/AsnC family transcriptional regulator [Candidatus Lokiarchaeota archaeon]|nr:Lrp/AsnC family transcriptional regulator [Candidatus Lokiarchaeota archaeon]